MSRLYWLSWVGLSLPLSLGGDCRPAGTQSGGTQGNGNDLDSMRSVTLSIGESEFSAWIAETEDQRSKGLMFVTTDQMQPTETGMERGMLFVFDSERVLSFWMKDTVIPLDIAYARSDGTIVKIHTMTPLDLSGYSSEQPARFALEVNANLFKTLGISEGDVINIPEEVLNPGG